MLFAVSLSSMRFTVVFERPVSRSMERLFFIGLLKKQVNTCFNSLEDEMSVIFLRLES